jgi:hypothetical protein
MVLSFRNTCKTGKLVGCLANKQKDPTVAYLPS